MLQLPKRERCIFFFWVQNEGSGCIYRPKLTLRLLVATVCVPGQVWLTLVVSSFSSFLALTLVTYLKVFPKHIGLILVPGKIWMSSFQNTNEIENPIAGSKVMALGTMLMRLAWFSRYLNSLNSNFNP